MSENKTGKYLKYAIGEIILVVIGILIALSINNWNEIGKERQQEQVILQSLKTEFENNKQALQGAVKRATMWQSVLKEAFTYTGKDLNHLTKIKSDSIMMAFINYVSAETRVSILNDLLNTGNIHLIQNNTLKNLLNGWSVTYADEVKEVEKPMFDLSFNMYRPFLNKHLKAISNRFIEFYDITSGFEEDYKSIYNMREFEKLSVQKMNLYRGAINGYKDMMDYCGRILEIIDIELN